jgi:hypothetical protein
VLKSNRAAIVRLNAKLIKRPVVYMHATVPSYASLCMHCYPWACLCPQVCCYPHACWLPLLHHWRGYSFCACICSAHINDRNKDLLHGNHVHKQC